MKDTASALVGSPTRHFAVMGAHGGAGVSTVVRLLDPAERGSAVELAPGAQLSQHYIPVVVARSTAYGLARTGDLLTRWHPGVPRPWLVIVRDAPLRPPLPVRYRARALASRTLGIAHVPYLYRLRCTDNPGDALSDKAVKRASRGLRTNLQAD